MNTTQILSVRPQAQHNEKRKARDEEIKGVATRWFNVMLSDDWRVTVASKGCLIIEVVR